MKERRNIVTSNDHWLGNHEVACQRWLADGGDVPVVADDQQACLRRSAQGAGALDQGGRNDEEGQIAARHGMGDLAGLIENVERREDGPDQEQGLLNDDKVGRIGHHHPNAVVLTNPDRVQLRGGGTDALGQVA